MNKVTDVSSVHKWIFRKGALALGLRVTAILTTLGMVSGLSFWLPKADYGVFAMMISAALLASAAGGAGQRDYLVREVAIVLSSEDQHSAQRLIIRSVRLICLTSGIVGLFAALVMKIAGTDIVIAFSTLCLVFLLSINEAWSGAARAFDRFVWAIAPRDILWRGSVIGVVSLGTLAGVAFDAASAAMVAVFCLFLVVLLQGNALAFFGFPYWAEGQLKASLSYLKSSLDFALINVSGVAFVTLDILAVGLLISQEVAAEYYPANRLGLLTAFFFMTLQLLIAPRIATAFSQGTIEELKLIITLSTIISALFGVVIGLVLVLGYHQYSWVFPTSSTVTHRALSILVVGQVLRMSLGFGATLLVMSGYEQDLKRINIATLLIGVSVILAIAALTQSVLAVALATALIVFIRSLWVATVVYQRLMLLPFYPSRILVGRFRKFPR